MRDSLPHPCPLGAIFFTAQFPVRREDGQNPSRLFSVRIYSTGCAPGPERRRTEPGGAEVERDRATGRDVILAVVENMRQSLEPLVTETVAPSLYRVYLHGEDYEHLRTLFGKIENETKKVLDQEMERLNRDSVPMLQRLLRRKNGGTEAPMRYVAAESGWYIRF